jgi:MFS family permease
MAGSGLGAVFRVPEFRVLWAAELFSIAGDQLARVALAVLVYGRTGSSVWAAVAYALTFLPALLGGVLLSGLADRYRRREVMIVSDVARAVLVAVMAIPDLPLWALCTALVAVVLLGSPHTAAQGALYPEVLRGELYERGLAVRQITSQTAQLVGFATGGLLVAAVSPAVALLGNAVSFALSAVVLRIGVSDRPAPVPAHGSEQAIGGFCGIAAGLVEIATDRRRRALVLLAWLVGWYVVPEALAAPYADHLGAGPAVVGLLMAADPLGSMAVRAVRSRRDEGTARRPHGRCGRSASGAVHPAPGRPAHPPPVGGVRDALHRLPAADAGELRPCHPGRGSRPRDRGRRVRDHRGPGCRGAPRRPALRRVGSRHRRRRGRRSRCGDVGRRCRGMAPGQLTHARDAAPPGGRAFALTC